MKKASFQLILLVFAGFSAYSQNVFINFLPKELPKELYSEIRGKYQLAAKKEKLQNAKLISEIISDFPSLWISNYFEVEISATCNGKIRKAKSTTDKLSREQKNILNSLDEGTNIKVLVKYNYKDVAFRSVEDHQMQLSLMVVPVIEAKFKGGEQALALYLKEKINHKIKTTTPLEFQHAKVTFIVNEKGEISNPKITASSGDIKTDKLIIDLILKMPKWEPAQNEKGLKLKQEFQFSIGNFGC